jgi:putative transposase
MVRPADRRRVAEWAGSAYQVSERRACTAIGMARSTLRYESRRPSQEPLRRRLRELASVRTYAGYRRLHTYLRREGWRINHKRVYRLYSEEGLALRRKKPRRRRSVVIRRARPEPTAANQSWSMDFMHDALVSGRTLRIFTLIDVHTRECLALKPGVGFSGAGVAQILNDVAVYRPLPERILVDNKTEFASKALDAWAYWNQVKLDFSRRGKPGDNAHIEAFNSLVRRECLSQHWFTTLEEAGGLLERWKEEYNNDRPHGSLRQMPPARYRAGGIPALERDEPETRRLAGSKKG